MKTNIKLSAILDGALDNLDINNVDLSEYASFSDYIDEYASNAMHVNLSQHDLSLLVFAYEQKPEDQNQRFYVELELDEKQIGIYEVTE